jgi:hypothetical protein
MSKQVQWKLATINNSIEKLFKIVEKNESVAMMKELKVLVGKDKKFTANSFDNIKDWFNGLQDESVSSFKKEISLTKYETKRRRISVKTANFSNLESIRKEKNLNTIDEVIFYLVWVFNQIEEEHGKRNFLPITRDVVNGKGPLFPL